MQTIAMYLNQDISFFIGEEEFLVFTSYENVHGGEEITIKKSRWDAVGCPLMLTVTVDRQ